MSSRDMFKDFKSNKEKRQLVHEDESGGITERGGMGDKRHHTLKSALEEQQNKFKLK